MNGRKGLGLQRIVDDERPQSDADFRSASGMPTTGVRLDESKVLSKQKSFERVRF